MASGSKTGRLVIADLANKTNSAASEIAAIVAEEGFGSLVAPSARVATPNIPIPFSPALEKPLYPNAESIAAAIRNLN